MNLARRAPTPRDVQTPSIVSDSPEQQEPSGRAVRTKKKKEGPGGRGGLKKKVDYRAIFALSNRALTATVFQGNAGV